MSDRLAHKVDVVLRVAENGVPRVAGIRVGIGVGGGRVCVGRGRVQHVMESLEPTGHNEQVVTLGVEAQQAQALADRVQVELAARVLLVEGEQELDAANVDQLADVQASHALEYVQEEALVALDEQANSVLRRRLWICRRIFRCCWFLARDDDVTELVDGKLAVGFSVVGGVGWF